MNNTKAMPVEWQIQGYSTPYTNF